VIVKGCLDERSTCEPELGKPYEPEVARATLENALLQKQIDLLEVARVPLSGGRGRPGASLNGGRGRQVVDFTSRPTDALGPISGDQLAGRREARRGLPDCATRRWPAPT
jgi:hypothetical protein